MTHSVHQANEQDLLLEKFAKTTIQQADIQNNSSSQASPLGNLYGTPYRMHKSYTTSIRTHMKCHQPENYIKVAI